jgi:hypothetical protein
VPLLAGALAVVVVVIALAATPFWAPAVMQLLPWGGQPSATIAAKPQQPAAPAMPDATLATIRAEANQNAAAVQLLGQRLAALEAKPAPPLPPDLSPLEQQLGALNKTTVDLTQRVAALDKAAQTQPATDPKNMALALVLLQIREAVEIGRPFDAEYHALVALAHDHPDIASAAAPLAAPADSGVASRAVLAERLRQLAPQIATAEPLPDESWRSQIMARLRSLVTIRRISGAAQSPAEAAVGTAQHDLASGDLAGAVTALDGLAGPAQAAAQPWLQMAKQRLAVEAALRQVQGALTAALANTGPASKG